jgi:hypothetical protein
MRFGFALGCALAVSLVRAGVPAPQATASVYDRDPEHLWNRLYAAIAVRTESGQGFGADNSEPYLEPVDDRRRLLEVLDDFLEHHGERLAASDLQRALLLADIWAAFDLAASPAAGPADPVLRRRLARVIERLSMPAGTIAHLPDNYTQAVRSGEFAGDFDPQHPERAFLPPDLLDPEGPWVQIQDGRGREVASMHLRNFSGRSAFLVLIRCPGGRAATLSYLQSLNLYTTPFEFKPAEIATSYPSHEKVRWDPLRLDPGTPQFPEGTIVALVRRMLLIDAKLEPVPTPITQQVQFRVYQRVGGSGNLPERSAFIGRQIPFELVMRREPLLHGQAGGLHAVTAEETEYQLAAIPTDGPRAALLRGPVVLLTCARCHYGDGIFSVNSYKRFFAEETDTSNPQLLPATDPVHEGAAAVAWKVQQFDWGLLRGLLERDAARE